MTRTILLTTAALALAAGPALAQDVPPPAAPAPTQDPAREGVLVFQPDCFAASQPNTALDMIGRLPGFSLNDGSGARGFEGAVGNVLVNGVRPASKSDTASNVLNRTPAAQVARIELIRGGAPGIDMQGYPVVANVILNTASTRQQVIQWDAALFDGADDTFGARYEYTAREGDRNWAVILADGLAIDDSTGPGRVVRTNAAGTVIRDEATETRFGGGATAGRLTYGGPLLGGRIEATSRVGVDDYRFSQTQSSATVLRETRNEDDGKNFELGLTYQRPLSEAWRMEARLIHESGEFEGNSISNTRIGDTANPEEVFAYDGSYGETILRGLVRNQRSETLTFETGAELAYNMRDVAQSYTVGADPIPLPSATVKVEEVRGQLFGQTTWRMRPTLSLEAGLRLENSTISQSGDADTEETFFFAKPRLQATWTPWEHNQFQFRIEREVSQLDFDDFSASADLDDDDVFAGNVNLAPEERWTFDASWERRFWSEGVLMVALRHDRIDNVIDVIPIGEDLSAIGNIGAGTQNQLEVELTVPTARIGVPGGRLKFDAEWTDTQVDDPTTGLSRRISDIRPFMGSVTFEQDLPSLNTVWGFEYLPAFEEPNYDPDFYSEVRLRNYVTGYVEWKPRPDLTLRAQATIWNDFQIDRIVYSDRETREIAFVEQRDIDPRFFAQFRIRKTL